jgi:nucleotide-binding universal stress UspA family protein
LRGDVTLRRRIDHGDPYLTIQRIAQLGGYDLIVVAGPEGQRASDDTVAKALLATAPCAVLFVPPNAAPRLRPERDEALDGTRILVPLALAGEELQALECAEALTSADPSRLEVLISNDVSAELRSKLRARPSQHEHEEHEEAEPVVAAIQRRSQAIGFDLLVFCAARSAIGNRLVDSRIECAVVSQSRACLCLPI